MSLNTLPSSLQSVEVPDSLLTRQITEFVRDSETELLFNHSSRVYYFAALSSVRRGLYIDRELVYAGAMFHDLGLMARFSTPSERFEVDGANAAKAFLQERGVDAGDAVHVWTAIALHTTPGITKHMNPLIALVTAGVEMDVLGIDYGEFDDAERQETVKRFPRTAVFKDDIIQAFYDGIRHKPNTTFGNVKADVLAEKDAQFRRGHFCSVIRTSPWAG